MAVLKIKSSVGFSPRQGSGPKVKNDLKDVQVVRNMLIANGFEKLSDTGKCDKSLLSAILIAQKRAGIKNADRVVDPGQRTEKFLFPKYAAAEKAASNVKMVRFKSKLRGKELELTPEDHARAVDAFFKSMRTPVSKLRTKLNMAVGRLEFYEETADLKNGFMDAFCQVTIRIAGMIKFPDPKVKKEAVAAMAALQKTIDKKDVAGFKKEAGRAELAVNKFSVEFNNFAKRMGSTGDVVISRLEFTSSAAFEVAGVLAVPVIMTYTRLPPNKAYYASKTGFGMIESASKELGKHVAGQDISFSDSAAAVGYDGLKSLAVATIEKNMKFTNGLIDKVVGKAGAKVMSKMPGILDQRSVRKFVIQYLQNTSKETVKSLAQELSKLGIGIVEKGRVPTGAELEKAYADLCSSVFLEGPFAHLEGANKILAKNSKSILPNKVAPKILEKYLKGGNTLTPEAKAKLMLNLVVTFEKKFAQAGLNHAVENMTGKENGAQIAKMAENAAMNDGGLMKEIDKFMASNVNRLVK